MDLTIVVIVPGVTPRAAAREPVDTTAPASEERTRIAFR
jgi:hypothetical protein